MAEHAQTLDESGSGAAAAPKPHRRWSWLAHPLVLLLVGGAFTAGITNYLVPSITRQWQNHDKELEIKSALVQDVNRAAFQFFETIRLIESEPPPKTLAALDRAYVSWRTSEQTFGATIQTYFPGERIAAASENLSLTMRVVYIVFKTSTAEGRRVQIDETPGLFDNARLDNIAAEPLQAVVLDQEWYRYDADVTELEGVVAERVKALTDAILGARSSL
jgi:hypothetical protein